MSSTPALEALATFQRAAHRVPAYRLLLAEAGVNPDEIRSPNDFARLPVLEKRTTFQHFPIEQLCLDGKLGPLASVLTSSGHSGIFAFGLTSPDQAAKTAQGIDDLLDFIFQVRSRPTLLINCLPMGVKVPSQVCTLAETSVRADMVTGLVRTFATHFSQLILVGDAAFLKHVLELGRREGINWPAHRIHMIVGEELLAENARKYLERLLGIDHRETNPAMVVSSMGVAELGLNLFSEVPPAGLLVRLRRLLHEHEGLRHGIFGPVDWVPSLFTYDEKRIFVEFDDAGRLILTTLDPSLRIPLVRYATGDCGRRVILPESLRSAIEVAGIPYSVLDSIPLVAIRGRGDHVLAGAVPVYPEAIKEGIYYNAELAGLTTANFRVTGGAERARVRLQLSRGVATSRLLAERFREAIRIYVRAPLEVTCEAYEIFGDGMELDYERKFQYLASQRPS